MLSIGDTVDDFTLDSTDGKFTLSERVKDGYVLLYFYVVNYGKTCTDYMALMNERVDDFRKLNVTMYHVNPETVENHRAWMEHTDAQFVHLSDREQKVSKMFDCIVTKAKNDKILGYTNRGLFLIGPDMKIRYAWRADWPNNTVPMDELLDSIREAIGE